MPFAVPVPANARTLCAARTTRPGVVAELAAQRRRPASLLGPTGRLMVVAADHPARGALGAGDRGLAMADRGDLLDRICVALSRPEVNGVLGTADVLEDLLLLGALDDKVVIGSMNRGGIAGACFEIDDRPTGYDPAHLAAMGFDAGKMLVRIDLEDRQSVSTLETCARTVTELADRGLMALVEPFFTRRVDGRLVNDLSTDAVIRAVTVAAGMGSTSAYTWLKLPVTHDVAGMEAVLAASNLPVVLLGGEVPDDPGPALRAFQRVLQLPTAAGLVLGRSLLYPKDDDVAGAVDRVVGLL